jgi:NADPH-dependent curcumin reductase CurA
MAPSNYKRIVLHERPLQDITPTTFRTESLPLSSLKPSNGQVLVQVTWISLDPAMRGYLRDARSYMPPVQIGEVMRASGMGIIVQVGSGNKYKPGDIVMVTCGERPVVKLNAGRL